jgi:hypothetical protein
MFIDEPVRVAGLRRQPTRQGGIGVFWKRSHREERRQKVLDELFALDPAERRNRLDRAVAAGEVHASEVDSTLKLVQRLDALSVFTLHPAAPAADPASDTATAEPAVADPEPQPVAIAEPVVHDAPRDTAARARRSPVGVPVVADTEDARRWLDTADMPLDALEAASRLVARDRAARRPGRTPAAPETPESTTVMPVGISIEPAEPAADENWPSIAWLRP